MTICYWLSQSSTIIEVHSFILITPYQWFKESIQLHSWSKYIIRQCLGEKEVFHHLNKRYFISYNLKKTVLLCQYCSYICPIFPIRNGYRIPPSPPTPLETVTGNIHQFSNLYCTSIISSKPTCFLHGSFSITFHLVKDLNSIIQFKTRLSISEVRKHLDGLTNLAHTPHY